MLWTAGIYQIFRAQLVLLKDKQNTCQCFKMRLEGSGEVFTDKINHISIIDFAIWDTNVDQSMNTPGISSFSCFF